jgi:DNA-binding response OmpR family regulator
MEVMGKPFDLDVLARRVEAILQGSRPGIDREPAA